jgi:tetratricopeptide (TPR) repeat protein
MSTLSRLAGAAALLVCLTAVARAEAPPSPAAIEEARGRFQRGVQLFREGSFDGALAEFRKAYQVAPSYRLLYNIAQVHYELHDYVEALRAFRQYLNEGQGEVAAERRAQVEMEIAKLEARVATLEITTNVDGGEIWVDDVPVGLSPLRGPVLVNAGVRRVSITKAGRSTAARTVTVAGGERTRVVLQMLDAVPARLLPEPTANNVVTSSGRTEVVMEPDRTKMWVSLAATGALAVGAGTFALLARKAKDDFDKELNSFPTTRERVDASRSRLITFAALTDGLGAAALLAGGLTVYFALSTPDERVAATPAPRKASVQLSPTVGGAVLHGRF